MFHCYIDLFDVAVFLVVVQILREAIHTSPSIVYLPHLSEWCHVITEAVRANFVSAFNDLDPSVPVLLLATSDVEYKRLSTQASVNSFCYSCSICDVVNFNHCVHHSLRLYGPWGRGGNVPRFIC